MPNYGYRYCDRNRGKETEGKMERGKKRVRRRRVDDGMRKGGIFNFILPTIGCPTGYPAKSVFGASLTFTISVYSVCASGCGGEDLQQVLQLGKQRSRYDQAPPTSTNSSTLCVETTSLEHKNTTKKTNDVLPYLIKINPQILQYWKSSCKQKKVRSKIKIQCTIL